MQELIAAWVEKERINVHVLADKVYKFLPRLLPLTADVHLPRPVKAPSSVNPRIHFHAGLPFTHYRTTVEHALHEMKEWSFLRGRICNGGLAPIDDALVVIAFLSNIKFKK